MSFFSCRGIGRSIAILIGLLGVYSASVEDGESVYFEFKCVL